MKELLLLCFKSYVKHKGSSFSCCARSSHWIPHVSVSCLWQALLISSSWELWTRALLWPPLQWQRRTLNRSSGEWQDMEPRFRQTLLVPLRFFFLDKLQLRTFGQAKKMEMEMAQASRIVGSCSRNISAPPPSSGSGIRIRSWSRSRSRSTTSYRLALPQQINNDKLHSTLLRRCNQGMGMGIGNGNGTGSSRCCNHWLWSGA